MTRLLSGAYELIASSAVNYLSKFSSQASPYIYGLNGVSTSFFNNLSQFVALNQGWFFTSSIFALPNLYLGSFIVNL